MKFALVNGIKQEASPKTKGNCPLCYKEVVPKCGKIKVWHWSHKYNKDCDDWYENESEWHKNWKDIFPTDNQEVTVGRHRADIKLDNGMVIELQNSSISSDDIIQRELFYGNMIWILNGKTVGKGIKFRKAYGNGSYSFRWKHPHKSWWNAKKKKYIDFGEEVFLIKNLYYNVPCGGWGTMISKKDFVNSLK